MVFVKTQEAGVFYNSTEKSRKVSLLCKCPVCITKYNLSVFYINKNTIKVRAKRNEIQEDSSERINKHKSRSFEN